MTAMQSYGLWGKLKKLLIACFFANLFFPWPMAYATISHFSSLETAILKGETLPLAVIVVIFYAILVSALACYFAYHYFFLRKKFFPLSQREPAPRTLLQDFYEMLAASSTAILIWTDIRQTPFLYGKLPALPKGVDQEDVLNKLELWLPKEQQTSLQKAVQDLCLKGEGFELFIYTLEGALISAKGQISGDRALLRLQDVSAQEAKYAKQEQELLEVRQHFEALASLLNKAKALVYLEDKQKKLLWANELYHTQLQDAGFVKGRLFPDKLLADLQKAPPETGHKASVILSGERYFFNFYQIVSKALEATLALDISEAESLQQDLNLLSQGYTESFDLLPTGVAIFDENLTLRFANRAFARLWKLEEQFLSSHPSHAKILDHLKENGLLPEQSDWRAFRENLFAAYRSAETLQYLWVLPDGRSIRVFAHPQPKGGVIWLYEDLTEKITLQTKYNSLIKTQGETLDALSEGVVLFGSDGRIRLTNTAFARLWQLPPELAVEGVHIQELEQFCKKQLYGKGWSQLSSLVTSYQEGRDVVIGQMNLTNDLILEYKLFPLPEGQNLISFADRTAQTRYAQALQEKNDILRQTEKLRSDFIKHVSYELRTPLTTLIGYTQILAEGTFGSFNKKQKEFLDHITLASSDLLNIVNDILDLASVDAGMMQLHFKEIQLEEIIESSFARVEDQRHQKQIQWVKRFESPLPKMVADGERLRQILVKLLLHAIQQSPFQSKVELALFTEGKFIILTVKDEGMALDEDILTQIYRPFPAKDQMAIKSAAALGLSLAKGFVELHGGIFKIERYGEKGSTISCYFPQTQEKIEQSSDLREEGSPSEKGVDFER